MRASAISAFVNMVHEARLMWLDARKMHLGAAFHAIYVPVQPLRLALDVWHFTIIKMAGCRDDFTTQEVCNQLEIAVLTRR